MLVDFLHLADDRLERPAGLTDQSDALIDLIAGCGDQRLDLLGGIGRPLRKRADLLRDDRKTPARIAGPGGFDAGIARQEIGLEGDRSEERRVGKEGVRKCRSRWSAYQ